MRRLCWHHYHTQCDGLCAWCTDSDCDCPHDEKALRKLRELDRLDGRGDE